MTAKIKEFLACFIVSIIVSLIFIAAFFPYSLDAPSSPAAEIETPSMEIPIIDTRADRIDAYFAKRGMPLSGYGSQFVASADEYGIEWTLLPAIAVAESSGGKQRCGNNPFGWGSCRVGVGEFSSVDEAIEIVSKNLGGANPRTARAYAGGLDADLWSYNGSVNPAYPGKVKTIMAQIEQSPLGQ